MKAIENPTNHVGILRPSFSKLAMIFGKPFMRLSCDKFMTESY